MIDEVEITNNICSGFVPYKTWVEIQKAQNDIDKKELVLFDLKLTNYIYHPFLKDKEYQRVVANYSTIWVLVNTNKSIYNKCTCTIQNLMLQGCKCGGK